VDLTYEAVAREFVGVFVLGAAAIAVPPLVVLLRQRQTG